MPTRSPRVVWTDENIAKLKVLWRSTIDERTTGEIGKMCGGASRSTVFRKAQRLGLGNRPSNLYPEGRPYRARPSTVKTKTERPLPPPIDRAPILSAPKPVFTAPPAVESLWLALPVPRASRCQYPLWTHISRAPTPPRFCDHPTTRESYCEEHASKVFRRRRLTELA